ncbi:carrier protein [Rhizoctonia solani AG-3 Rhs1AP]|uniref:Carrier protein n=2 Tax=Rhizoctonia solani AG-3 TaxID=1086053 RepID=A0A074RSL1_9AGAM|nr:carrier protein [Rhizoctonia solani AG-3 Rhs1AP]KEP49849.1 carrier protein [Rhizoctonia solani 123E]
MINILKALLFLLFMLGPIALGIFIIVPISGAIVRLRASYSPKGLQLDQGDDTNESSHVTPEASVGPAVISLFNVVYRTYRLEGWPGFYKGFMPAFVSTVLYTLWAILTIPQHPQYIPRCSMHAPATDISRALLYGFGTLVVSIPYEILFNRAVCTPHRLPWFKPMQALRIILTPYEIRKPWMLYFTPGLLHYSKSHCQLLIMSQLRNLSSPIGSGEQNWRTKFLSRSQIEILFLFIICSTVILCPLEVFATRLSIQRNQSKVHPTTDNTVEPPVEYIGEEEDVITLRSEEDPYTGLVDCAQRMVREEGVGSVFRAWWLTMIGVTLGAFS